MAKETHIGWCDSTHNFWIGCKKVSEACKFCYMFRDLSRFNQFDPKGYHRTSDKTFNQALKWKDSKRIFTCSWSDFFLEAADQDRPDAWEVIRKTPQHIWLILTKRPERILDNLPSDWGNGYDNVWIGVTAENQERLVERVSILSKVPCSIRFISIEPILGEIDLFDKKVDIDCLDWIIVGGESGNETGKFKYRESKLSWYKSVVLQSQAFGIPVFVKQLGTYLGKKMGFRDRKGATFELLPEALQLREFPDKKEIDNQLKFF